MRARRIPEPGPGIHLQGRIGVPRHYLDIATVVIFNKVQSGWAYTYVAIRPASYVKWSVSGVDKDKFTWDELLEFMGPKGRETLTIVTEAKNKSVTP